MSYRKLSRKHRFKNFDEFVIIEELGKGGYSIVYLVEHKKSGKRYAIKCAKRIKKGKDKSNRTLAEIKVLRKIKHPNIIRLKGWFEDKETIYLVLEYCPGKDMSVFFKNKLPSLKDVNKIMLQLVNALKYCHDNNIIHRDIKLENILIDEKLNIKLTDFGLCAIKEDDMEIFTGQVGTVRYTSPELLTGDGYNESIDVWDIGIVLFMLLTGKYPFDGKKKDKIFKRIQYKNINYNKYDIHSIYKRYLKRLLIKDPYDRAELEDIIEGKWFE